MQIALFELILTNMTFYRFFVLSLSWLFCFYGFMDQIAIQTNATHETRWKMFMMYLLLEYQINHSINEPKWLSCCMFSEIMIINSAKCHFELSGFDNVFWWPVEYMYNVHTLDTF